MRKKLTITVDEAVYEGLHRVIGRRKISRFVESLVRPHVIDESLLEGYRLMSMEEHRELEAEDWADATAEDALDEAR